MPPFKVLIVDDSAFMRSLITNLISENPRFQVVSTAKNGLEAVDQTRQYKPDVITMDIEMPEMNGLQALEIIMKDQPTPVIMLSSLTRAGADETIKALELGAIDFIKKPSDPTSLNFHKIKSLLYERLEVAVATKKGSNTLIKTTIKRVPQQNHSTTSTNFNQIVALGTSTGGPKSLSQVLTMLPDSFPAPILIVQHMPPNFTKSLATSLNAISHINVIEAENNLFIQKGTAYIAPGGYHMTLQKDAEKGFFLHIHKGEPRAGHRPSVDTLFESLIPFTELKKYVILMTGMGSDGAKGMLALKSSGALSTIAESEETCVVFGMPKAAIDLNCVNHILPNQQIAAKLVEVVSGK